MRILKLIIASVIATLIFSACGETPYKNTIEVFGVVIGGDNKPVENASIVVFLDNVEIYRTLSTPFVNTFTPGSGSYAECSKYPPVANRIGHGCNNLNFSLPRVAEFNQDLSNITINLRNIQIGETKTYRSIDGRFLVFQVFPKPPVRSLLLLQSDDSVITPLPGTVVATPTFSGRPTPTDNPITDAPIVKSTSVNASGLFDSVLFQDWIRPLIISIIIGLLVACGMYISLSKKKESDPSEVNNQVEVTQSGRENIELAPTPSAFSTSVVTGTISALAAVIIQKALGL